VPPPENVSADAAHLSVVVPSFCWWAFEISHNHPILKSTSDRRKSVNVVGQVFFLIGAEPMIRKQTHPTVSGREKTAVLTYKLETARSFSIAGGDSRFLILIRSVLVAFTSIYPNLPNHQFALAKRERE